jgi:two-component system response regulator YesN
MCRVIIADDEPKVSLLIKSLILWDELGLQLVATASDGISALALIEEHRPDIVITDIRMPGYDGIELIERAKALDPGIDFIIISGYRHFEYAQKAIRFGVEDYLLKPLKAVEINQTLRKMIAKYKERDRAKQLEQDYSVRVENDLQRLHAQLMSGLLQSGPGGKGAAAGLWAALPATLNEINRDFSLSFADDFFQVFVVKADVHFESLNPNVRKLLVEKSSGVVRDALRGKCHVSLLYPTDRGIYVLVNFGEAQQKPLRKALVSIIDELQSQSELFDRIRVTVGLGRQARDIRDMALAVREAEAALANRLTLGAGRILDRVGDLETAPAVSRFVTAQVRNRLLTAVEILDGAEIATILADFERAAAADEGLTGKALEAICEELVQILRFGLKSQNAVDDWVERQEAEFMEKFAMCSSQKEVFLLLAAYAETLIGHVTALRKSESNKPVREAQKYIQANFAQPVSLESVSLRAGFNPTYFSLLFKKETGMNFLEYLTDVRIREAKRLLSDPRKTIADVSAGVGYSDVKHFSKVFTRITGIHPSKYRKLYY